jgi:hypothetical protein
MCAFYHVPEECNCHRMYRRTQTLFAIRSGRALDPVKWDTRSVSFSNISARFANDKYVREQHTVNPLTKIIRNQCETHSKYCDFVTSAKRLTLFREIIAVTCTNCGKNK